MDTREAVAKRIYELCDERGWSPNHPANVSAVPQATVKSILNGESSNPGIVTIKKLCDGFEITLSVSGKSHVPVAANHSRIKLPSCQ